MGRLDGKVAIVTGAARGMGRGMARHLAAEGARVVIADILEKEGEAAAAALGDRGCFARCDMTSEQDWERTVATAVDRFGGVHALVNNAAVLHVCGLEHLSVADFQRVMLTNTTGVFLGMRAVAGPMKAAGGGSIVNVTSISAMEGTPFCLAYVGSKWAVRGMTRTAAMELGPHGIRVNTLTGPGAPVSLDALSDYENEMVKPFLPEGMTSREFVEQSLKANPPIIADRRVPDPDRMAPMVVFLVSDDSAGCTGVDFDAERGQTATYSSGNPAAIG